MQLSWKFDGHNFTLIISLDFIYFGKRKEYNLLEILLKNISK